ncbi:hypothetical protein D3C76_563430 [compost metagenome]
MRPNSLYEGFIGPYATSSYWLFPGSFARYLRGMDSSNLGRLSKPQLAQPIIVGLKAIDGFAALLEPDVLGELLATAPGPAGNPGGVEAFRARLD